LLLLGNPQQREVSCIQYNCHKWATKLHTAIWFPYRFRNTAKRGEGGCVFFLSSVFTIEVEEKGLQGNLRASEGWGTFQKTFSGGWACVQPEQETSSIPEALDTLRKPTVQRKRWAHF
jgi:hypothetical protein